MHLSIIAFDADDTLWHNETLYHRTQDRFKTLLDKYIPTANLEDQLYQTEMGNLPYFGFGIKSFTLSMIETAGRLTDSRITSQDLLQIVQFAKDMLDAPVELLPGVKEVIEQLSREYHLMIVTKGDLLDQKRKLAQSGLEGYFEWVEVVTDKTPEIYRSLFEVHQIDPRTFLMVGNSLRSDILPIIGLRGYAVYIPFHLTWAHEHEIDHFETKDGYYEIDDISMLPGLIQNIHVK